MENFVSNYANVIRRYATDFDLDTETATKHFMVLTYFLRFASLSPYPCFPDKTIDNAWHTFIIHTKQYTAYCHENFKRFIHHNPIEALNEIVLGYHCTYELSQDGFQQRLMMMDQAFCDGGGESCSSCYDE